MRAREVIGLALGVIIALVLCLAGGYLWGRHQGRADIQHRYDAATVAWIDERDATDAELGQLRRNIDDARSRVGEIIGGIGDDIRRIDEARTTSERIGIGLASLRRAYSDLRAYYEHGAVGIGSGAITRP